jgi:cell division protein ZapA (FtsZ GTPase activity inhibitor)
MAKRSISVRIRGHEFRVRSDDDEAALQRVAGYLDETMTKVEEKTGTVDSLSVAMLTALNLAREVVELREGQQGLGGDPKRLRSLIDLAESALEVRSPQA